MKKLLAFLFAMFFAVPVMAACTSNQIDVLGDGTQCETAKFTLTTVTGTTSFQFSLSAKGTFYVDCGNSGTLTSDSATNYPVSGTTVNRTYGADNVTYTCTWGSGATQTIKFGGTATDYNTGTSTAAISFYAGSNSTNKTNNAAKVASISGSLGQIFPVATNGNIPRFHSTFINCIKLTGAIPVGLFSGIDTSSATDTSYMFYQTFAACSRLTGAIPADLFSGIDTSSATNTSFMFDSTFYNCTGLTSIPAGLFSGIDTSSSTNTRFMFRGTFQNCTGLTGIPAGLFSAIDTSNSTNKTSMFRITFSGCSNITGYIEPSTFAWLTAHGSPTADNMWTDIFYGTKLLKTCPSGATEYNTGYKSVWGGYVSCEAPFTLTTASNTTSFQFSLSAKGTFYVDCGNSGALSGTGVSGTTISRSNTTEATYTCTWGTTGTQTIRFGGTATGYSTNTRTAAIAFYMSGGTQAKISSISGNLSTMFPYISGNAATGAQPRFYQTFYNATSLTSIPDTLFENYTTGASFMFNNTFYGCTGLTSIPENLFAKVTSVGEGTFQNTFYACRGLTSIPENLFAKITSGAPYMFYGTFGGCTGLTSIPANLFAKVTSSASGMFYQTFQNCTGLTSIPENLFAKVTSGAPNMFYHTFGGCTGLTSIPANLFAKVTSGAPNMFCQTFYGCTGLTSIPANLFSKITTGAQSLFQYTFYGCTGLTSIPENLFFPNATSVTGQTYMFNNTFYGCTGLTSIPENLFAKVTSGAEGLFYGAFKGCTKLGGYIPKSTFAGLIANNSPTANYMWQDTFTGTQLVSSCPSGTTTIDTTYKGTNTSTYKKWGNYAMCEAVVALDCSVGYYLPANANACAICPINNVCSGGTYTPSDFNQGITACASGTFAPTGSTVCYPHILHVGDDKIYMNSTKQTTPSLNFRIGNDVFFINMTTTRTKMNKDSDHYFHVQWGNNDYYMCDNTTCPQ